MNALLELGTDSAEAEARAEEMLRYFRLPENLWSLYPNTFSGGERLRLNLAHTMVKQPRLMLLDEPTASLDNKTKVLVKDMLMQLKEKGKSMVGIFHDAYNASKEYGMEGNLLAGANIAGFVKVADAMMAQGIV